MKKAAIALLTFGALMNFSIHDVLAQTLGKDAFNENETLIAQTLQTVYPANRIRWVRETPVKDLWEVTMATNVAYVVADVKALKKATVTQNNKTDYFRYWLFGASIFDMKASRDMTAPARQLAQMIDVSELPLQNAITRKKGNGYRVVYVFTDPDCPHCRRLEETLERVENVTIHTFLTPITVLHPKAREVSAAIWCAKDRARALLDYMTGEAKPLPPAACETPILANEKLMESLSIKGTPTIFFETGERHTGSISVDALEKQFAAVEKHKANLQ